MDFYNILLLIFIFKEHSTKFFLKCKDDKTDNKINHKKKKIYFIKSNAMQR